MALVPVAHVDSSDDDGVNVLNGNNVSVLPVEVCDGNVLGKLVNQDSSSEIHCENAPLADHPTGAVER